VHTHTHTHIYTYTHTHSHTHRQKFLPSQGWVRGKMSVPYILSSEGVMFRSLEIPTQGIPLEKNFYPVMFLLCSTQFFLSAMLSHKISTFSLFYKVTTESMASNLFEQNWVCSRKSGSLNINPIWISSDCSFHLTVRKKNPATNIYWVVMKVKKISDRYFPLWVDNSMEQQPVKNDDASHTQYLLCFHSNTTGSAAC